MFFIKQIKEWNRERKWKRRYKKAEKRKNKLLSFGENAHGILTRTEQGIFVVDPEDNFVSRSLLQEGYYSLNEIALAESLLAEKDHVLVVGAHIGSIAIPLSKKVEHMVAIEANPGTYELLKMNLRINVCSNVDAYNLAANDESGTLDFLVSRDNSGGSKRQPVVEKISYTYDQPELVKVNSQRLDDLVGDRVFDLVFMDIEGSEYYALKGMPKILSAAKHLIVEFLPHHLRDVAGVSTNRFAEQIIPFFNYMYVPRTKLLVEKKNILATLNQFYADDIGHDNILFTNEIECLSGL